MPEEMLRRSTVTGIEIDPLTARIAKALYPDADIREQPFEKSKLADESFDLAISNVPFGDYTVHDPRWNKYKFPIHDYFFPAVLDKVRPGGLLMFITSHHTLDKLDSTMREMLAAKAELLGAIRSAQRCLQEKCRHRSHHRHRDAPQVARRRIAVRRDVENVGGFYQRAEGKNSAQRILRRPSRNDVGQNAAGQGNVSGQRAGAGAGRP